MKWQVGKGEKPDPFQPLELRPSVATQTLPVTGLPPLAPQPDSTAATSAAAATAIDLPGQPRGVRPLAAVEGLYRQTTAEKPLSEQQPSALPTGPGPTSALPFTASNAVQLQQPGTRKGTTERANAARGKGNAHVAGSGDDKSAVRSKAVMILQLALVGSLKLTPQEAAEDLEQAVFAAFAEEGMPGIRSVRICHVTSCPCTCGFQFDAALVETAVACHLFDCNACM